MDERIKNIILRQGHLYRGTNDLDFSLRKDEGIYFGVKRNGGVGYITCTSVNLLKAIINGANRCGTEDYKRRNAKPVLLAINPEKYINSMELGLESGEVEIRDRIDFKDIIVINSLDNFLRFSPDAKQREIDLFKLRYLSSDSH
ncbi:MAG: hypothetical protein ABIE36_03300 [Candidatus Diapherotrites archaeon]